MFGYVNIYKPELKVKDYMKYKGYYCGLCQILQKQHGLLGKMTLSYDMTFLIVFLSSIYEPETDQRKSRCIVHPLEKRPMISNVITEYAASMNIVLMYYKLADDWADDRNPAAMAGIHALRKQYLLIEKQYPDKCKRIKRSLKKLAAVEKRQETNLDEVSRYFGELMAELFVYRKDIWEEDIRGMAFYLGKFIYLMDAYDDLAEDIEKNRFNPLKKMYQEYQSKYTGQELEEQFTRQCESILTMMMAECTARYEKLPCVENAELLGNILYAGVWNKFDQKKQDKNEAVNMQHEKGFGNTCCNTCNNTCRNEVEHE